MTHTPAQFGKRVPVWFENGRGVISHGELVVGAPGSRLGNLIYCCRSQRWFENAPCWQTIEQYEKLKRGDRKGSFLGRTRGGSLHADGWLRAKSRVYRVAPRDSSLPRKFTAPATRAERRLQKRIEFHNAVMRRPTHKPMGPETDGYRRPGSLKAV